jgi:DNA-binding CsgD family transcriptional regulator
LAVLIADPGQRAYHLAGAGRRQEAVVAAQDAADRSTAPGEKASLLELVARMSDGPGTTVARIVAGRLLVASGGSASARAIALLEPIVEGPVELLVEREALLGKAYWDTGDLVNSRAAYERGRRLDTGAPFAAGARLAADEAASVMNVDGDVTMARRILGRAIGAGRSTPRVVATHETIRAFIDGVDTFDAVRAAYETLLSDPDEPGAASGTARNVAYLATMWRGHNAAHEFLLQTVNDFDVLEMAGRADDLRGEDVQVLLFGGRLQEALRLADELLERPLNQRTRHWTMTKRAQVLAAQGQSDAASAALDAIAGLLTGDYPGIDQVLGAATRKLGAASRAQAAAMLAAGEGGSGRARPVVAVRDEADAGAVVLAALDGAAVTVDSATDPALVERIQDDLRRLGRVDAVRLEPVALAAELTPEGLRLLGLLVEGLSLGEAAGSLHLSRRTADRRLAAARRALGAATTAEALVTIQRRWLGPPG